LAKSSIKVSRLIPSNSLSFSLSRKYNETSVSIGSVASWVPTEINLAEKEKAMTSLRLFSRRADRKIRINNREVYLFLSYRKIAHCVAVVSPITGIVDRDLLETSSSKQNERGGKEREEERKLIAAVRIASDKFVDLLESTSSRNSRYIK